MELSADLFQKVFNDNLCLLQALPSNQAVNSTYVDNLIELTYRFINHVSKNELGVMFRLLWEHYKGIHSTQLPMTSQQGRIFIMLTHLGSHLGKDNEPIREQILLGEKYLLFLKKYMELLMEDQGKSADKKVIVDMLKEEVLSLLAPSPA